jgi:endonuclease/exonuclease/phosphatase family metal-dependent hydrolase
MRLRVVTYNIHRAIGVDRRFRPDRIVSILREREPDVVLLQEVDEGAPRSRELDLAWEIADAAGLRHVAVGHNVTLRKGRYGNATLSRFPIARERNIDLTVGRRKRRGCQHTTVVAGRPGGSRRRVEVFNLHLGLSAVEREHQIGLLVRSREFLSLAFGTPCLVAGDFNDWRSRLVPILCHVLGFRVARERTRWRERPLRTFPSFLPRGPLDAVYYRGALRLVSAVRVRGPLPRVASDHLPVSADFELS